ncbi:hypothetical protein UFOVP274_14 [uncultured Caudovirales phage]|uniref:Uncharacterized protein n=1 Tax=uncultured Caudovirales phage TaxID=2100421 RepID=A0A6J5LNJ5_9CAUD|nr:hypothetical protein UFOVP274_14 [uncultured Caudovirales phage]
MSFGFGFGFPRKSLAAGFTPLSLFAAGEVGAWYDPSNFSTLFQDSAGTTPVTAVEQPVGLMLDGSKGLALGAELVTNGDFSNGLTGWTNSSTGTGTATVTAGQLSLFRLNSTNVGQVFQAISGTSFYRVTFTVISGSVFVGFGANGGNFTAGSYSFIWYSVPTNISLANPNDGTTGVIDNISVKALPGNHAFQTTSANRPTLSARYNLLTKSQQYDDAAWTKSNAFVQTNLLTYSQDFTNVAWNKQFATVVSNTAVAPDETTTASLIYPTSTGPTREIYQAVTIATEVRTHSVYVKSAGFTWVYLGSNDPLPAGVFFNLSGNGAVGTKATNWNGTITPVGNGWFRITATSPSVLQTYLVVATVDGDNTTTATTNGTSGIYIWGAQLVQGSVPGDYRATTSAALPVLYSDPIGGVTAEKLCEDAATAEHFVQQIFSITKGVRATFSGYVKAAERQYVTLYAIFYDLTPSRITFNLNDGTASTITSGGNLTVNPSVNMGNGWWRFSFTMDTGTGAVAPLIAFETNNGSTYNYLGDGSSGIYVWGSDLRPSNDGVGLPAYQRVNTSTDYDTAGFPPYLLANGSTTSLATNSIDFSATNKMTVWAGVRKLSDAALGIVAELGATGGLNSFTAFAPRTVATGNYGFTSQGSATSNAIGTASFASPITNVVAGIGDIAAPVVTLRVNGTQDATNTATQGTGNYGNYPLYIGARAGTSLFFNGRLYSLIVRGASTTATTLSSAETWVNSKTKAY